MRQYKSLKKIQTQEKTEDYLFSIAVRVKNELKGLKDFWQSLQKQTFFNKLEITFLDSGSDDGTISFLKDKNCNIYTIDSYEFNFGDSCNLMMTLTTCENVFMFSGHVYLQDDKLIEKTALYINIAPISGYFRQIPYERYGCSIYDSAFLKYRFPTFRNKTPLLATTNNSFSNAASVISRIHWQKNNFEDVVFGEDEIWFKDVLGNGASVYYFHYLNVMHSHNDTYIDVRKRISKAAIVKYPEGKGFIGLAFIFIKVFFAVFINSGELIKSIKYAHAHAGAYADIRKR